MMHQCIKTGSSCGARVPCISQSMFLLTVIPREEFRALQARLGAALGSDRAYLTGALRKVREYGNMDMEMTQR